jgi:hypothetical protein
LYNHRTGKVSKAQRKELILALTSVKIWKINIDLGLEEEYFPHLGVWGNMREESKSVEV